MKLTVHLAALGVASVALLAAGCAEMGKPAAKQPPGRVANTGQGDSWNAIKELPDFWGGVWDPAPPAPRKPGDPPPSPPPKPQLTAEFAAKKAAADAKAAQIQKGNKRAGLNYVTQVANCVPYGLPSSMHLPYPFEFLFTPGRVTILIETDAMIRRIYTDGRPMPEDPDPTYQGTSIGHWEGDTLVVETSAINLKTVASSRVEGHGPNLHVTERIHLVGPDRLEIDQTLSDPTVFAAPYSTTAYYQRHRDWNIMEYICAQNNHDGVDANGSATFDLSRKPGE